MSWFSRSIDKVVKKAVAEAIEKVVDERLPSLIDEIMEKGFRERPDRPLTPTGYLWAFALAMEKKWPDVGRETAAQWCKEELKMAGIVIGQDGYEWTARTAQQQVNDYIAEHGESA